MINDEEIRKYKNIKAPLSLKEKIIFEKDKERSTLSRGAIYSYAAAALLFLVLTISLLIPEKSASLYFGNIPISDEVVIKSEALALARIVHEEAESSVVLTLRDKDAAAIFDGEEVEADENGEFTIYFYESELPKKLTVKTKKGSQTFSIFKNDKNETVLSEIKK